MAFWNKENRVSAPYDRDNPYQPAYRKQGKPWYQQSWVWVVVAVAVIGLLMYTGTVKNPFTKSENATKNVTQEQSLEQQLVNYIISEQNRGVTKIDIEAKLQAAGYNDAEIVRAFELADPVVQYIILEQSQGRSKQEIVDALLNQGYELAVIQQKFAIVEKKPGTSDFLKKYWWVIAAIAVGVYLWNEKSKKDQADKAPKVFTLEECREYAEEKLTEKKCEWNPSHRYKNRPELRQYRFCFEEPIFAEFNHHFPSGNKSGGREYYLCAVGYDKELVEFRRTKDDVEMIDWIYGSEKPAEQRATSEYVRMRQRSEVPLETQKQMDQKEQEEQNRQSGYPQRPIGGFQRRPARVPGPIEGYEAE